MEQVKKQILTSIYKELWFLIASLRPKQWTKNLIIYFSFFFAINKLWNPDNLGSITIPFFQATMAFFVFCGISGVIYLINDWMDLEQDRAHPVKRNRPLASKQLNLYVAIVGITLLIITCLTSAIFISPLFLVASTTYLVLMVLYSLTIKRIAILDVATISAGFVLRAAAGAVAIGVPVSPWLYITTSLGALFIGFGKRRNELHLGGLEAKHQRSSLGNYSEKLLNRLLTFTALATIISYVLYTLTAGNLPKNHAMELTIPLVIFGVSRYLYLIRRRNLGESPEDVFLSDLPLILSILLWLAAAASVLLFYGT